MKSVCLSCFLHFFSSQYFPHHLICWLGEVGDFVASKLSKGHLLMEHIINLLQSLSFALWDAEVRKEETKGCDRAEDESNFRIQPSVCWVNEIRNRKVHGEAATQN